MDLINVWSPLIHFVSWRKKINITIYESSSHKHVVMSATLSDI